MSAFENSAWAVMRYIKAAPGGVDITPNDPNGADANDGALKILAEELMPLERTLEGRQYTCGDEPGIDDFRRSVFLETLLAVASVYNLDEKVLSVVPHIRAWMARMRERPSFAKTFPPRSRFLMAHARSWHPVFEKHRSFPASFESRVNALSFVDPVKRTGGELCSVIEACGAEATSAPMMVPEDAVHLFLGGNKLDRSIVKVRT